MIPKFTYYIGGRRELLSRPMSELDVTRIQRYYQCKEDLTNFNDLANNKIIFECNFEKDFCGLEQDKDDGFDWVRKNKPPNAKKKDIPADYKGNGYYITATSKKHTNQSAILRSQVFQPGTYCIAMALYNYGPDPPLNGTKYHAYLDSRAVFEHSFKPNYGPGRTYFPTSDNWFHVEKRSFRMQDEWRLVLTFSVVDTKRTDVAIDDLVIMAC